MPLIDSSVDATSRDMAVQFQDALPFRHVVVDGFLDENLCHRLLADFPPFEDRHALNEMGQIGRKAVRMDVRDISDAYRDLDDYLQTSGFLQFMSRVTGIPDLLHDPDYVGGGTHENREGQSLDAHVDFNYHPRTHSHRRLNLIIYLNPEWHAEWGGALELHSDPWNEAADEVKHVVPLFNRCVIFETTESSWHGFSQIRLPTEASHISRKSFAIYLYTKERPLRETAPKHATIYVPESLPADWRAGRTLSRQDAALLRTRSARMRSQLRYLYEREKQFGAQLSQLEHALEEARAAQRLDLQGYATQPNGASGIWPDGWVGKHFGADFTPTRKTRSLVLDIWVPGEIGKPQELDIMIAGSRYAQIAHAGSRTTVRLILKARSQQAVSLRIRAAHVWTPAADGLDDARELAFKIVEARLEH